eukprot:TRINITY_DN1728_c0_g1_i1.p1 TRINITY_DN1728_c0_g1~~TRINITY_DN1728_c0_g1_i1.p1  ORF type:complete len:167 (+),score=37.31 TRINITY_DN1728_c0_g1_i1:60-503(+)
MCIRDSINAEYMGRTFYIIQMLGQKGAKAKYKFKEEVPEEERRDDVTRVKKSNPGYLPVLCEPHNDVPRSIAGPYNYHKFVVEPRNTIEDLIRKLRRILKLKPDMSLYLICGKSILKPAETFKVLSQRFTDNDGYIYITFRTDASFG